MTLITALYFFFFQTSIYSGAIDVHTVKAAWTDRRRMFFKCSKKYLELFYFTHSLGPPLTGSKSLNLTEVGQHENNRTCKRIVRIEFHPKVSETRQQFCLNLSRGGVVHPLWKQKKECNMAKLAVFFFFIWVALFEEMHSLQMKLKVYLKKVTVPDIQLEQSSCCACRCSQFQPLPMMHSLIGRVPWIFSRR